MLFIRCITARSGTEGKREREGRGEVQGRRMAHAQAKVSNRVEGNACCLAAEQPSLSEATCTASMRDWLGCVFINEPQMSFTLPSAGVSTPSQRQSPFPSGVTRKPLIEPLGVQPEKAP